MRRVDLEAFLGQKVELTLVQEINPEPKTGYLWKTGMGRFENNPNLYLPRNYYFLTATADDMIPEGSLFRCSHVRSCNRKGR